jgi:hypothetical protein
LCDTISEVQIRSRGKFHFVNQSLFAVRCRISHAVLSVIEFAFQVLLLRRRFDYFGLAGL